MILPTRAQFIKDAIPKAPVQPPREWPTMLLPMKLLAKDGDTGLGDIVARVIGPVGGDAFKEWFQNTFGKSCGCSERQKWLNGRYPLQ